MAGDREDRFLMRQRGAGTHRIKDVDFGLAFPIPQDQARLSLSARTTRSVRTPQPGPQPSPLGNRESQVTPSLRVLSGQRRRSDSFVQGGVRRVSEVETTPRGVEGSAVGGRILESTSARSSKLAQQPPSWPRLNTPQTLPAEEDYIADEDEEEDVIASPNVRTPSTGEKRKRSSLPSDEAVDELEGPSPGGSARLRSTLPRVSDSSKRLPGRTSLGYVNEAARDVDAQADTVLDDGGERGDYESSVDDGETREMSPSLAAGLRLSNGSSSRRTDAPLEQDEIEEDGEDDDNNEEDELASPEPVLQPRAESEPKESVPEPEDDHDPLQDEDESNDEIVIPPPPPRQRQRERQKPRGPLPRQPPPHNPPPTATTTTTTTTKRPTKPRSKPPNLTRTLRQKAARNNLRRGAEKGAQVLVYRLGRTGPAANPDEDEADFLHTAPKYVRPPALTGVDVLTQVLTEMLEAQIEGLDTSSTSTAPTGAAAAGTSPHHHHHHHHHHPTPRHARRALLLFADELKARLFALAEVLDYHLALSIRLRTAMREKALLREELVRVRKERDEVSRAIESAMARAEGEGGDEARRRREEEVGDGLREVELVVRRGRALSSPSPAEEADAVVGLEFLLRRAVGAGVAAAASASEGGLGLLSRVRQFNGFLERTAAVLEEGLAG